jgi:dTMP kinase
MAPMTSPTSPPRFLVLEGIDGSGTTTQAKRVGERLRARGHRVVDTREPSPGPIGTLTRSLLTAGAAASVGPEALALLFAADRLEHLAREIEPALAEGALVLCDRYVVSSWVYQSLDCELAWVQTINRCARWPDLTFVFDLPAELALARVAARRATSGEPLERFDHDATQRRLAAGYRRALDEADAVAKLVRIDAAADIEAVSDAIMQHCIAAGL